MKNEQCMRHPRRPKYPWLIGSVGAVREPPLHSRQAAGVTLRYCCFGGMEFLLPVVEG